MNIAETPWTTEVVRGFSNVKYAVAGPISVTVVKIAASTGRVWFAHATSVNTGTWQAKKISAMRLSLRRYASSNCVTPFGRKMVLSSLVMGLEVSRDAFEVAHSLRSRTPAARQDPSDLGPLRAHRDRGTPHLVCGPCSHRSSESELMDRSRSGSARPRYPVRRAPPLSACARRTWQRAPAPAANRRPRARLHASQADDPCRPGGVRPAASTDTRS